MKKSLKMFVAAIALLLCTKSVNAQVNCNFPVVNTTQCSPVVSVEFKCNGTWSAPQVVTLSPTGNPGDNTTFQCNCPGGATPTAIRLIVGGTTFVINPPVVHQPAACSGTVYVNADATSGASIDPH